MGEIINKASRMDPPSFPKDSVNKTNEPSPLLVYLLMWFAYSAFMTLLLVPFDLGVLKTICAGLILGWFSMLVADKK